MDSRAILPLIDLVFLTLGAILAAMTQMERVTALPVDISEVGPGAAIVRQGEFAILAVMADGLSLDETPITREELPAAVAGRQVIVRADRTLQTQELLEILADLVAAGAETSLEVEERVEQGTE